MALQRTHPLLFMLHSLACLAFVLLFMFAPQIAMASAFQNNSQSVSAMGRALAGAGSFTNDASSLFYNPALMVMSPYKQLTVGNVIDIYHYELETESVSGFYGGEASGNDTDKTLTTYFLPSFYYSQPLFDRPKNRVWLGLGVTTPFSQNVEYDNDDAARYQTTKSYLYTVNINPSVAVLVTPQLSLGAGFSAQWLDTEFMQSVDAGGGWCFVNPEECYGNVTPGHPDYDGEVKYDSDSWAFGWNVGALWRFNDRSFLGLAYRSEIRHDVDGATSTKKLNWLDDPYFYDWFNYRDRDFEGRFSTPATATLSFTHFFTKKFVMMLDVQYILWSELKDNYIEYDESGNKEKNDIDWNDTVRIALGGQYTLDRQQRWTLRFGIAYDPSPLSGDSRTTAVPDADSVELAIGVGYRIARTWQLDAAYAHHFYSSVSIDESSQYGSFAGDLSAMRDRIGLQVTKVFMR